MQLCWASQPFAWGGRVEGLTVGTSAHPPQKPTRHQRHHQEQQPAGSAGSAAKCKSAENIRVLF